MQPFESVRITEYDVVTVGETLILLVLDPSFQLYEYGNVPPDTLTVIVLLSPSQIS